MSNTTETTKYASMGAVIMEKQKLLNHLYENKTKHDVILANAIAGYWDLAKEKIDNSKSKIKKDIKELEKDIKHEFSKLQAKIKAKEILPDSLSFRTISVQSSLGLKYPENHTEDYERAISMMEASIFDKVMLTPEEYNCYVLNQWAWKKQFIISNTAYVSTSINKGLYTSPAVTGYAYGAYGNNGPTGPQAIAASDRVNRISSGFAFSGMSMF